MNDELTVFFKTTDSMERVLGLLGNLDNIRDVHITEKEGE